MRGSRIAELLQPFLGNADPLTDDDLAHISTYIDILLRWNARMNLTAVRNPEEIVTRHFGESFFAARHLFPKPQREPAHIHEEDGSIAMQHGEAATRHPEFENQPAPAQNNDRRTARAVDCDGETAPLERHNRTQAEHSDGGRSPLDHDDRKAHAEDFDRGRAALQDRATTFEESGALAPVRRTRAGIAAERQDAAHVASRGSSAPDDPAAEQRKKITLADIGSGAGFPGIPMKLWAPEIHLTLIESNQKKATFLKEITRALTLTNVDIQNTRAESVQSKFDTVTLRAVERFGTILPVAANLVSPGGRLALLIGSTQLHTADTHLPNFERDVRLPIPQSSSRTLQLYRRKK